MNTFPAGGPIAAKDFFAVDGGGMDADVEGRPTVGKSAFDFLFEGHCVRVGGMGIACFFYRSMLIVQRPLRVKARNDAILLDTSPCFVFSCE